MKTLIISVLLAIICIGIAAYMLLQTPPLWPPTIDNLFFTIIFLTMAGVFFLNALLEVHAAGGPKVLLMGGGPKTMSTVTSAGKPIANIVTETGLVEDLKFYEATVGDVNKSVVVFRPEGAKSTRLLVFENNLRDQLPVGRKVTITYRPEGKLNQLLARS